MRSITIQCSSKELRESWLAFREHFRLIFFSNVSYVLRDKRSSRLAKSRGCWMLGSPA